MDSINIPIDTYNVVSIILIITGIILVFGSITIIYFYDKLTEKSDNIWSGIGLIAVWSLTLLGISSFMAGADPLPKTINSKTISNQLEDHGYSSPVSRDVPIVNGEMLVLADKEQNTCIGTLNIKENQLYVLIECRETTRPSELPRIRERPEDSLLPLEDYRGIPMDENIPLPMIDPREL